jgi:hypothetical protein
MTATVSAEPVNKIVIVKEESKANSKFFAESGDVGCTE